MKLPEPSNNKFELLNTGVLQKLKKKCKKGKLAGQNWTTCKDLTCRAFYFEPNKYTIKKWREEGLYKKGIDRRVIFVCERPGPNSEVLPDDIEVKRCWGKENANNRSKWRLDRFLEVRNNYGLENCYITNIVKCSSHTNNTPPSDDEIKECSKYFKKEIEIIQPEVIVAVGMKQVEPILQKKDFREFLKSQNCKLIGIWHYSRGNPWPDWHKKFKQIKKEISSSPKFIPIF